MGLMHNAFENLWRRTFSTTCNWCGVLKADFNW